MSEMPDAEGFAGPEGSSSEGDIASQGAPAGWTVESRSKRSAR